jgi:hypothetical protein
MDNIRWLVRSVPRLRLLSTLCVCLLVTACSASEPTVAPAALPVEPTSPPPAPTAAFVAMPPGVVSRAEMELSKAMRKLWEDHVTWTRLYIVSVASDGADQELVAQRLLRNQSDIGAAIKPFYGDEAGDQLTTLLEEHITGAVDLIAAAKVGDDAMVEDAKTKWYANADAIAAFLNGANPEFWPLDALQAEMKHHLDLTLEEATARLTGDYAADIEAYDEVHDQILAMADMLTMGIVAQFPDRFQ